MEDKEVNTESKEVNTERKEKIRFKKKLTSK